MSRRNDAQNDVVEGARCIATHARRLPTGPGVYRMLDENGTALYVGKARNLQKRVASYTRPDRQTQRIMCMIALTRDMEFVTTETEAEALLLEANLIKRLKPRFNIVLRDDKSFPYILMAHDHEAPRIVKHRGARKRRGDYFGPFASSGAVDQTLNTLQRAFLLRSCSDSVYENRSRPCLLYQIKRCSAPCTNEIPLNEYGALVRAASDFLTGRSQSVKQHLLTLMQEASDRMDFERAATYRDRLSALSHIQSQRKGVPGHLGDMDAFAIHQEANRTCIQVFFFRNGQNWGNRAYFPQADREIPADEILAAFLAQFYDDKIPPPTILLSSNTTGQALLAKALTARAGRPVGITVPRRGDKHALVTHALNNARDTLRHKLAETDSQAMLIQRMADRFGLNEPPKRIEVYDNSHIQGAHAVGAMIVAGAEGFIKNQYRKFNIKSRHITPGDDYAMMREVLTRRFKGVKELSNRQTATISPGGASPGGASSGGAEPSIIPDLILIDGGQGQLSCAHETLCTLGLERIRIVGIAKGPNRNAGQERLFMIGHDAFSLPERDPILYFIQRLRDEAHRFAIGSHRVRRKNALGRSALDEINGIGPNRKKALLQHFGSMKAISRAGRTDLESVPGISIHIAQSIYDYFHDQKN